MHIQAKCIWITMKKINKKRLVKYIIHVFVTYFEIKK